MDMSKIMSFGTELFFPNFSLVPKLKPLQKTQLYKTNEEPLSVPYIHNNNFFFSKHFPKRQNLDSFRLKDFADDNFKTDEKGRRLPR